MSGQVYFPFSSLILYHFLFALNWNYIALILFCLSWFICQVIVKQEICRKLGYAIQAEEETLKVQLEQLQVELNHPTQFKVCGLAATSFSLNLSQSSLSGEYINNYKCKNELIEGAFI